MQINEPKGVKQKTGERQIRKIYKLAMGVKGKKA
jgi:hypothetical protein